MRKVRIWDIVNNNPRANRQYIDWDEKAEEEEFNQERMLYDEKMKNQKRLELIKRMIKSYNKKIAKTKDTSLTDNPPKSPAEKRALKLADLLSRSSSWKNLR